MHHRNQKEKNIAVNFIERTCSGKTLREFCDDSGSVHVNISVELMFDGMYLDQPVTVITEDFGGRTRNRFKPKLASLELRHNLNVMLCKVGLNLASALSLTD